MSRKFSLKDLIDKIDWVSLNSASGGNTSKLPNDAIAVSYLKSLENKKVADKVRVRIGKEVMEALDWAHGDKIVAMYDPDDIFSLLLCKSNGSNGRARKITKESKSDASMVTFKWENSIVLKPSTSSLVEHDIYNGYVHFRLPDNG